MNSLPQQEPNNSTRAMLLLVGGGLLVGLAIGLLMFSGNLFGNDTQSASSAETLGDIAEAEAAPVVGAPAPGFDLVDASTGQTVTLDEFAGRPVIINFWATWCGPCRIEMPAIQAAVDEYDEIVVLAINNQESQSDVAAFGQELGLTFSLLLDPDGTIQEAYRVRAYPSTYFIRPDGTVNAVQIGVLAESQLYEHIDKLKQ